MKSFAYIQNLRIPHEMAHSVAVVKAAEAGGLLSDEAYLIHPKRIQTQGLKGSTTHDYYDLKKSFKEIELSVPELRNLPQFLEVFYKRLRHLSMSWVFAFKAWAFARRKKIDVIQTGDREILLFLKLMSFLYKPKIIYDLHNDFDDIYNRTLLDLTISIIDVAVVNCPYLEDYLKNKRPDLKCIIEPNGFDPKYYPTFSKKKTKSDLTRKQLGIAKKAFVFGYVGRFETMGDEKGIGLMIQAAKELKEKIPVVVLAVGGPKAYADHYRHLAEDLGISEQVVIVDQVPPSEVASYIDLFDVSSLLYPDTFHFREKMSPMKAIEYLAAGKTILASDLPTTRHVLQDQAEYVTPSSRSEVVQSLQKLYKNPKNKTKDIKNRLNYVKKYSWVERQKRIFQSLT